MVGIGMCAQLYFSFNLLHSDFQFFHCGSLNFPYVASHLSLSCYNRACSLVSLWLLCGKDWLQQKPWHLIVVSVLSVKGIATFGTAINYQASNFLCQSLANVAKRLCSS